MLYTNDNILVRKPIMKITSAVVNVESSGIQSEAFFNIKDSNVAHIFGILRNKLYSNKPLAVIREYCTNAFDAHVEAGIPERPIEVSFPTAFKNTLTIRDFGFGLSEDDIYNVFASYGESTKRDTNDQVGMMGLGSKSAFCYVNDFTITSYHNGTKKIYLAYIDETNVGKISKLSEEPTNETGLAIDIAVKTLDISSFRYEASQFLKEFTPVPIVHNDDSVVKSLRSEDRRNYVINTPEYKVYSSHWDSNTVRMGNVNYEFKIDDLGFDYTPEEFKMFVNYNRVKIYAEIGSVVPSASRESLEFDDQTKSYIINKLYEIRGKMVKDLQELYSNCRSKYELTLRWNQTSPQRDIFGNGFEWNGERATKSLLNRTIHNAKMIEYRGTSLHFKKQVSWVIRENQTFYLYTRKTVKLNSIKGRISQYGEISENSYVLEFPTQSELVEFQNNPDYIGVNMVDLSKVNYVRPSVANTRAGMVKADVYEFRNNQNRVVESWIETKLDLQQSEGVYVSIKAFRAKPNFYNLEMDLETFQQVFQHLSNAGIKTPTIYGVKERDIPALGNNWIELSDYIQQAIYNLDEGEGVHTLTGALISGTEAFDEFAKVFRTGLIAENNAEDIEFKQLVLDNQYRSSFQKVQSYEKLCKWGFDVNVSQYTRFVYLRSQFLQRYPIFNVLFGLYGYNSCVTNHRNQAISILNDYILCK